MSADTGAGLANETTCPPLDILPAKGGTLHGTQKGAEVGAAGTGVPFGPLMKFVKLQAVDWPTSGLVQSQTPSGKTEPKRFV